jgi:hypothetical protein
MDENITSEKLSSLKNGKENPCEIENNNNPI